MKIIFTLLCLFFSAAVSESQLKELHLAGQSGKLDSELVMVRDASQRLCSCIKVISDMDGFKYQSYNGVVRVDDHPGEDLVFVSPDERVLEIYKSGYKPLKLILSEIGIILTEKQVWQIEIAGEPEPNSLSVVIITQPEDALIKINGTVQDSGLKQYRMQAGIYDLLIEKEGFVSVDTTVHVDKSQTLFEFTLLPEQEVNLYITSDPPGAVVYLGDIKLGMTPVNTIYPEGRYFLRVQKELYGIYQDTLDVIPPRTLKAVVLDENVTTLSIKTHPDARVYMNEKELYDLTNIRMEPGMVHLRAEMPGAEPVEEHILLKRNEHKEISLYPEILTGTIQVAVTPSDASIVLASESGDQRTGTGEVRFEDIPAGSYELRAQKHGYEPRVLQVVLRADEKVAREIKLFPEWGTKTQPSAVDRRVNSSSEPGRKSVKTNGHGFFIGLRAAGVYHSYAMTDFNETADSWNDLNRLQNTDQFPDMYKFTQSIGGQLEVLVNIRSIAIGLGAERINDKQSVGHDFVSYSSTVAASGNYYRNYSNVLSSELIFSRLYLNLFSASFARMYIGGGFEKHRLSFKDYFETDYVHENDKYSWDSNLRKKVNAVTAIGGLEFKLFQGVWLFANANYRWMQVKGLSGSSIYRETTEGLTREYVYDEENLYYVNERLISGETFKSLVIQSDKPAWNSITNVRKAVIDLTGVNYTIGLCVRMF